MPIFNLTFKRFEHDNDSNVLPFDYFVVNAENLFQAETIALEEYDMDHWEYYDCEEILNNNGEFYIFQ